MDGLAVADLKGVVAPLNFTMPIEMVSVVPFGQLPWVPAVK